MKDFRFNFFMDAPTATIQEKIPVTQRMIDTHDKIICSISGGSDSDDMLDLVWNLDPDKKIIYVFMDTGIEMDVTKRQLVNLENKYRIHIETIKPKKPVPLAVAKYGCPFYSKIFSEYIHRLQIHDFKWEDRPFEELYAEYPKCKAALRWWCNCFKDGPHRPLQTEIGSAPFLKEYMIENPPHYIISPTCCECAKKRPADQAKKRFDADISFVGIRKAEGGARSKSYKTCFVDGRHGQQHFPLFWWKAADKQAYEQQRGIVHSEAYTVYGCHRTGCAGCPYGSGFEQELEMLCTYEPKLYAAVSNIFAPSYDYTRKYREFKDNQKELCVRSTLKNENLADQLSFYDEGEAV